jgi:lipopolysaccharide transport system permease protein
MNNQRVIEADTKKNNYWKELWEYRELFYILSWRDIKVRYKQTILGLLWSFIRPLITLIAFTIVFNRVANLQVKGNYPYALLVLSGLLPWQFFSTAFSSASESLITNSNLLTKVYFPRIIIPASAIVTSFIDFLISFFLHIFLCIFN